MPFIPHSDQDIKEMLATIGVAHIEDLFDEIPNHLKIKNKIEVLPSLNEMQLARLMQKRAALDSNLLCFIGAGAYEHHIPAAVWEITSRGEFLTAYTPYQAEASQGTLQLLYEYQTMMASLTGLDVSNASLYEGASALAEAILMAVRLNRKNKSHRILIPRTVHPSYRQVVKTIVSQKDIEIIEVPFDIKTGKTTLSALEKLTTENITACVIPQPNFFGCLEEVDALTDWTHQKQALAIALVNPLAMALLKPPGQWGHQGADIACGEGQSLGVPLSSGGPYYGFLCCKMPFIRQLPGRIVGRTLDQEGKPGFVLTLQAREQHIRRAKATSNICTNQGLLVTASSIYLSLLGPQGLRYVAMASHQNLELCRTRLMAIPGIKKPFDSSLFHEVVLQFERPVDEVLHLLAKNKIQGGLSLQHSYPELGNALLICVTETKTLEDIESFAIHLEHILKKEKEPLNLRHLDISSKTDAPPCQT